MYNPIIIEILTSVKIAIIVMKFSTLPKEEIYIFHIKYYLFLKTHINY